MTPWPTRLAREVFRLLPRALRLRGSPSVSAAQASAWRDAAQAAQLTGVVERQESLVGWSGRLRVELTRFEGDGTRGTRVRISGFPPILTLRREGADSSWRRIRGTREIEVGDAAFDSEVWVEGPPLVVRAILDAPTRQAVRSLLQGRLDRPRLAPFAARGQVEQGVLWIEAPDTPPLPHENGIAVAHPHGAAFDVFDVAGTGGAHFSGALRAMLALAHRLEAPADPALRIAENLKHEPDARVRARCLTALVREQPDHPATEEAVRAAREDPDGGVRLRAGAASGVEGHPILLHLALGEGAEDSITASAVAALGDRLSTEQAATVLRSALRTRREATARVSMRVLGSRGGPEAIRMLTRVLRVEHGALAAAAAHALATTGAAAAEQSLLAALDSTIVEVRLAVVQALGRVGTAAAVAPLRERETHDADLRAAARQAVAQIQARIAGAAPGQLSLAGGDAGALSFAAESQGELSFPEADAAKPESPAASRRSD